MRLSGSYWIVYGGTGLGIKMAPDSGGVETTITVRARVQATFLLLKIERKVVRCARHCRFYHQAESRVILAQEFLHTFGGPKVWGWFRRLPDDHKNIGSLLLYRK